MNLQAWAMQGLIDGALALGAATIIWLLAGKKLPPRFGAWLFGLAMFKGAIPLPVELPWLPAFHLDSPLAAEVLPSWALKAVPAPMAAGASTSSWSLLAVLWGCGVSLGIMRLAWLYQRTRRLRAKSMPCRAGEEWDIECRVVDGLHAPAVTGLWRPVVLLPIGLDQRLSAAQMRWMIAHEVAHARSGDLVWELLSSLLRIVCFFNPAVWLAAAQAERLREVACDEAALSLAKVSRQDSAEGFIRLIEWSRELPRLRLAGAGMSSAGREAGRRVRALVSMPGARLKPRWQWILGAAAVLAVLPGYRLAHAEDEPEAARIAALERRVRELETQLQSKSRLERLRERAASLAHARVKADEARFSVAELREIERLYQEAKQKETGVDIAAAFAPLIERFPASNRAGCAVLLLARLSSGPERAALLARAASQHAGDYFLDGTNVGGVARLMQAQDAQDPAEARKWREEILSRFAEELDFGAVPLADLIPPTTAKQP
ncbi:MAG: M48 family metalloprotease [Verrucomicrobiaceae bacterium]|nr:M48 family metalloprotease [Verrucomicrobiaceae bacterium]